MMWGLAWWAMSGVAAVGVYGEQLERTTIRLLPQSPLTSGPVRLADVARVRAATAERTNELKALTVLALPGEDSVPTVGPFAVERALRQARIDPATVDIFGASCCRLIDPSARATRGKEQAESVEPGLAVGGVAATTAVKTTVVDNGADESRASETALSHVEARDVSALAEQALVSEPNTLAAQLTRTVAQLSGYELGRLKIRWDCSEPDWLTRPASEGRYDLRPQSAVRLGAVRFELADKQAADGIADEAAPATWPTVRVRGYVELMCQTVVATRDLLPSQVITQADVKLMVQRVDNLRDLGFRRVEDVLGKEVARPIGHHQMIRPEAIRTLLYVKRNQMVTLRSKSGSVEITLHGRALKDGGLDDAVTVCYGPKRTMVEGRVTGKGEVTIGLGAQADGPEAVGSFRENGDTLTRMAYRGQGEYR